MVGRGDQHLLLDALLDQRGVGLERRVVEVLAGQEQDHEVGRLRELRPVAACRQLAHVVAQQPRVLGQVPVAVDVTGGVVGVQEGLQRRLGVDHHLLAAGHVHDQVGAQGAIVVAHRHLLGEVAVADHAGHLDHVSQLHLPPAATRLGLAQGRHQRSGLAAQTLLRLDHRAQLLLQHAGALDAVPVEPLQTRVHQLELFRDRRHQLLDRLLALLQLALGLALIRAQGLLGQRQELLVVLLQRVGRQRLEPVLGHRPLTLQAALEPRRLIRVPVAFAAQHADLGQTRAQRRQGDDHSDHESDYQPEHVRTVLSACADLTGRTKKHRRGVGQTRSANRRFRRRPGAARRAPCAAGGGRASPAATSSTGPAAAWWRAPAPAA